MENVRQIPLAFEEDVFYLGMSTFEITPHGIFVLFYSAGGITDATVCRYDLNGKFIGKMNRPGPGPGETRRASDLWVNETNLYVSEASLGIIHQFDHQFRFQRDIRIAVGGKIFPAKTDVLVVWGIRQKSNQLYLATAYQLPDFREVALFMAMPADERPLGVAAWGGFTSVDSDTFAAGFVHKYQIFLFNGSFQPKKVMSIKPPPHYIPYFPIALKRPGFYGLEVREWRESWHALLDVFFIGNHFLMTYTMGGDTHWDLINESGKSVAYGKSKAHRYSFFGDHLLWRVEVEEIDGMNHFSLVADKLIFPP